MSKPPYFFVDPKVILSDGEIACMSGDKFKKYWLQLCLDWQGENQAALATLFACGIIKTSQYNPYSYSTPRLPMPKMLRQEILERDGYKCVSCGSKENLQIDHIVPYSLRQEHITEGLQVLCRDCNLEKGAKYE